MFVVVSTSIIAVLLAYLSQFKINQRYHLLEMGFGLLAFVACIHYNYGPDYPAYYYRFLHEYNFTSLSTAIKLNGYEPGWTLLNWVLPKPYGFFILVALISILENFVYYYLIKEYLPPKHRWIGTTLYVGMSAYYLLNFSMFRQGTAVALVVMAGIYIGKKEWWKSLILVILASTIHMSAIVFLPFVILSFLPLIKGKVYAISLLVITLLIFLTKGLAENVIASLSESDTALSGYSIYQQRVASEGGSLGMGFFLNSIMYVVMYFLVWTRFDRFSYTERVFLLLSCIPLWTVPFQMEITGIAGRLGTYFAAFQMVTIPMSYSKIKIPIIKITLVLIYAFMFLNHYYTFFMTSWSAEAFNVPFHTIFEVII